MSFIQKRLKGRKLHHLALVVSVPLLLFVLGLSWYDSVHIPYIDSNFSYSADINATDSLYDTAGNHYEGQRYSDAKYFIQPIQKHINSVSLKAQMETITVDNSRLGTITRHYTVDPRTGMLQNPKGFQGRSYLFAPRNITKGTSFTYWHVTYTGPATMRYNGEEKLFGLNTYSYTADYSHAGRLEQNDIKSDVPAGEGLEYAPNLKVWIEPATGWLIKYEENTTVYYYNKTTGKRLGPADHFTTSFAEPSIMDQVKYAKQLRYQINFGHEIAPSIMTVALLGIVTVALLRWFRVKSIPISLPIGTILAFGSANIVGWTFHIHPLIRLFGPGIAINWLTSICLMLLAVSTLQIFQARRRKLALALSTSVALLMVIQMLGILHALPFTLDSLLFHNTVLKIATTIPDRMSLFGTLTLLILSTATVRILTARTIMARYIPRLATSVVIALVLAGFLAKIVLLDQIFASPSIVTLSVPALTLYLFSAAALLKAILAQSYPGLPMQNLKNMLQPALVALPIILFGVIAQFQQNQVNRQLQSVLNANANRVQSTLQTTVTAYTNMLAGAQALFKASHSVEADEWHAYVSNLQITKNYPGVVGVGYVQKINKNNINQLPFTLYSTRNSASYAPVTYIEPLTTKTRGIIGFDMYSDPTRTSAMQSALTNDTATMTSKVSLLQDTGSANASGFLIFLPIYTNGMPTATVSERQAALQGYAYVVLNAQTYFSSTLKTVHDPIHTAVYDGFTLISDKLLYENTIRTGATNSSQPTESKEASLVVDNHPWTIVYTPSSTLKLDTINQDLPSITFFGGAVAYLIGIDLYLWFRALVASRPSRSGSIVNKPQKKKT